MHSYGEKKHGQLRIGIGRLGITKPTTQGNETGKDALAPSWVMNGRKQRAPKRQSPASAGLCLLGNSRSTDFNHQIKVVAALPSRLVQGHPSPVKYEWHTQWHTTANNNKVTH